MNEGFNELYRAGEYGHQQAHPPPTPTHPPTRPPSLRVSVSRLSRRPSIRAVSRGWCRGLQQGLQLVPSCHALLGVFNLQNIYFSLAPGGKGGGGLTVTQPLLETALSIVSFIVPCIIQYLGTWGFRRGMSVLNFLLCDFITMVQCSRLFPWETGTN